MLGINNSKLGEFLSKYDNIISKGAELVPEYIKGLIIGGVVDGGQHEKDPGLRKKKSGQ